MEFESEPLPGVVNEAIVALRVVEPLEKHTATVIFLHVRHPIAHLWCAHC